MNQLFTAAENLVDLNDARVTGARLADSFDVARGWHPAFVACELGDWLVDLCGCGHNGAGPEGQAVHDWAQENMWHLVRCG